MLFKYSVFNFIFCLALLTTSPLFSFEPEQDLGARASVVHPKPLSQATPPEAETSNGSVVNPIDINLSPAQRGHLEQIKLRIQYGVETSSSSQLGHQVADTVLGAAKKLQRMQPKDIVSAAAGAYASGAQLAYDTYEALSEAAKSPTSRAIVNAAKGAATAAIQYATNGVVANQSETIELDKIEVYYSAPRLNNDNYI